MLQVSRFDHRRGAAHTSLIEHALWEYFPQGGLDCLTVPLDLGTGKAIAKWPPDVARILKPVALTHDHVVVVITNHTDRETGDLFLGTDDAGQTHTAEVDQVSSLFWEHKLVFAGLTSRTISLES